jgi:hypothetical protein
LQTRTATTDGNRLVVRVDEKLAAFIELDSEIPGGGILLHQEMRSICQLAG